MDATAQPSKPEASQSSWRIFWVFLRLGLTSFGGPIAHLGYFRTEFVERRHWLTDRAYADLVALCQFLPGPASSQVGMAIGLQRAGLPGLIAAWTGFTMPSALLMFGFALGISEVADLAQAGWVLGLKAAAVAVVAHAVIQMARTLTPDARRAVIGIAAAATLIIAPGLLTTLAVVVAGAALGLVWLRSPEKSHFPSDDDFHTPISRKTAISSLAIFATLLAGLPILVALTNNATAALTDTFYRAGSLVFGGGHVVLPLLEAETVQTGLVDSGEFLAGYGAAQGVPGPLFTFASFLGAVTTSGPTGAAGAAIALLAIFIPSALLVIGILPFWGQLRKAPLARRALMGVNASVVGVLAAALYDPVFTQGITGWQTALVAAVALAALWLLRTPAWLVVVAAAGVGAMVL